MAEQRVLFLGDSLTASKYWKAISLPEAVVAGKGFPGQPIGSVMKQGARLLTEFKPTDVVLLAGVNNVVLGKPKTVIMQDLLVAWKQIRDAGAKVWAAKLTPWFGYRMFEDEKFANKATEATRAINEWIASMRGQEGGPDYVIDTSALGDARGHLLLKYSHDKLHLNGKGYKKLASIVGDALRGIAPAATTEAGEDKPEMPAGIKYVINSYSDILKRRDIPPANVTWKKNEVTFWYWTPFRAETAKESVGTGTKYGAEMIYVYHRVIEAPEVGAGGTPVNLLQEAIEGYVDQLKAKDIAPAKVEYQDGTITFWFWTKFRADTAAEALPSSYKIAGKLTNLRMAVLGNVEAGQVPALNQETPYTCGPAALRAVLRHYGKDVSEDVAADAVANVPILGARPHGMVRGAQELGFHAVASYFRDPQALRPFVSHDVPVIVIVDSFLKPGKQGHYVVVTEMTDNAVTIMDPHKEGNWRKLSLQEFDARWWHKRPGADGQPEIARRLAIVVVPENVATEAEAGVDAPQIPVHGRIARCQARSGIHKWGRKVIEGGTKALLTIFGSGTTVKLYDKAMDAMYHSVQGLDAERFHSWFNEAPNEDVYLWGVGYLKQCCNKAYGDQSGQGQKAQALMHALGIERDSYVGERENVSDAALKLFLWQSKMTVGLAPCVDEHVLQSILILDYGPLTETWPIVEGAFRLKPKGDYIKVLPPWVKATLDALDEYRTEKGTTIVAVGGEYPPGVEGAVIGWIERLSRLGLIPLKVSAAQLEEPAGLADAVLFDFATQEQADRAADILPTTLQGEAKKVRIKTRVVNLAQVGNANRRTPTIRQKRFLDDAHESDDAQEVLKAYFLARKLGLDVVAETLGKRHQALIASAMPDDTEAGAKNRTGSEDVVPDTEWIFAVEYLKQVWPLIDGNRADVETLRKALKIAKRLGENSTFLFQANEEDQAFVKNAIDRLAVSTAAFSG